MRYLRGHAGIIGWVIVVVAVTWALGWQHVLSQRISEESEQRANQIERQSIERAHVHCIRQNETREAISSILDVLAAPREADEPGDYEQRLRLRQEVSGFLVEEDCPPPPPPTDEEIEFDEGGAS